MDKTMKDNELRKQILAEQAKKEREDDIQMLKDHAATEIKKENERKAYYNRIQRNANSFMDNAVQGVLREQQEKDREDEEKLNNYIQNKYKQEDEDEYKRLKKIHDDKINLRKYYDNQIKEKKLLEKYEKDIDKVQADIWKKDEQMYLENEKEVNKIIKDMYKRNLKALDELVQNKKKDNFVGMSENEVCHVRPHGRDSRDVIELPVADQLTGATSYTKHCFWINNNYIKHFLHYHLIKLMVFYFDL